MEEKVKVDVSLPRVWWNAMIDAELKSVSDCINALSAPMRVTGSKCTSDVERDIKALSEYKTMLENGRK